MCADRYGGDAEEVDFIIGSTAQGLACSTAFSTVIDSSDQMNDTVQVYFVDSLESTRLGYCAAIPTQSLSYCSARSSLVAGGTGIVRIDRRVGIQSIAQPEAAGLGYHTLHTHTHTGTSKELEA